MVLYSASHTIPLRSAILYTPIFHYFWFYFLRAKSDEQGRRPIVPVTSNTAFQPVHLVRTEVFASHPFPGEGVGREISLPLGIALG